ncbi:transcription initiation factor TFIID subunit 11 [Fopius arisanus]|uniref:Transcription initiation factor TFIID subunit 11 n=2 Tax=Fopius arisanus TaxID=64838 RepID=A0A9R1SWX9_9HYME|nr:PREDICTED: transcription initiation factor TFIID subunit 11 [Fopius arisanus]XP_011298675.1 PREDICTED: transcription initiation factor TFIID subunit 11 [Fopius arisanus]
MDNLFGKDDSENENENNGIGIKDSNRDSDVGVDKDDMIDVEEHEIKTELDSSGADAASDSDMVPSNDLTTLSPEKRFSDPRSSNDSSGMEIETTRHKGVDDLFHSDIVLPQAAPVVIKERRESKEKNKKELEEEEREKMQVLVSNFTEDQLDRYEMYRRAAFPKAAIKRIMQTITGCSVSQNVVIAMSGIAKVFVGEIVEEALDVMEANNESGPLQPKHLREAVRRIRRQGQIPTGKTRKAFLRL